MSTEATGYITDVEYTGQFYQALTPARLAYIALVNGFHAPDLRQRFTYCEMGCGKGITSLVLAATHPNGEFHAFDINPAHIDYAERLRAASGLRNISFHASGVAQMLERPLPAFDFVALHGLYSWVPDEVRGEIREFLRRKLQPRGLAMVSYNAMPGWAHLQPIRRMVQAYAASQPGDSLSKARAAFAYVHHLAEHGAAYFQALPAAAAHLKTLQQEDIRYVAHEYLTPHGDPFYFADVEAAMREVGLTFAGSMSPADNYRELVAAWQFQELLASAPTRSVLETHRDFIANTAFRQDLYSSHPAATGAGEVNIERLDRLVFCLSNLPERLPLTRKQGTLQYDLSAQAQAVQAVHRLLEGGPARASQIQAALPATAAPQAAALIQQLVVAQHLAACPPVRPSAGWLPLNSALIRAALHEKLVTLALACPQTGSATSSEPVHAACIEAGVQCGDAQAAAGHVLAALRTSAHPVKRTDAAGREQPATDAQVLDYAAATWRALRDPANPDARLLRQFGVLS